ncbi:sigma-70 family RNA polymerase sigma factor [Mucilaginibacter puniceus]
MNLKHENNIPDDILIERILHGDTNAFKTVIKNTERLVAQIIFKMIANTGDRKDIAQDVYLKMFQKLETFKFQSKLSTWIGQITYNTCLQYLEKKKLVLLDNTNSDKDFDDNALEIIGNQNIDLSKNELENQLFKQQTSEILKKEIDKLSPIYKTLITLYHNEELSYLEIGEITSLPEGTIKSYLFRARKELRDNLLLTYNKQDL